MACWAATEERRAAARKERDLQANIVGALFCCSCLATNDDKASERREKKRERDKCARCWPCDGLKKKRMDGGRRDKRGRVGVGG